MKKFKTQETLLAVINAYANGASYNQSAAVAGISKRTLWNYVAASRAGTDPELMVDLLGDGNVMTFEKALVHARRMVHLELRSRVERRALLGHQEPIYFQGQPTWKEDERCVGVDDPDIRELMGCARDGLLRDEQGRRVQHTIHVQAPVALALRVLEVAFPEYQPTTNVNTTNTNPPTNGATRGTMPTQPPVVPPRPPLPQLEVLPDAVAEIDLDELLGPEPEPADTVDTVDTVVEQLGRNAPDDTGPVIRTATPPDLAPAPTSRPLNSKLAGLLRR